MRPRQRHGDRPLGLYTPNQIICDPYGDLIGHLTYQDLAIFAAPIPAESRMMTTIVLKTRNFGVGSVRGSDFAGETGPEESAVGRGAAPDFFLLNSRFFSRYK